MSDKSVAMQLGYQRCRYHSKLRRFWTLALTDPRHTPHDKANVKHSSRAKRLRESFARLDLQHQERHRHRHHHRKQQDQPEVLPTARDADAASGGDGVGEAEEGGRKKPIDVETSLSVR